MKLTELTQYAYDRLDEEVVSELSEMIGCELELMEDDNFYLMPDGCPCHKDFLIVEKQLEGKPSNLKTK